MCLHDLGRADGSTPRFAGETCALSPSDAYELRKSGYAAVSLAPNSVGTAQLKNDAVVSAKVKNGSLLKADFKAGQLPAGPRGPAGPAGAAGAAGPAGPAGSAGPGARWALVDKSGNIIAQSGNISISTASAGSYYLNFGTNLSGKTLQATFAYRDDDAGFAGAIVVAICGGGGVAQGATCTAPGTNDTNHVFVRTSNAGNTTGEAHSFYIAVF